MRFNKWLFENENEQQAQTMPSQEQEQDNDDYYYHISLKSRLDNIKLHGLQPHSEPTFTSYQPDSHGRIFLCEKDGVNHWMHKVQEHEHYSSKAPTGVIILRIKKRYVPSVEEDTMGTGDCGSPCFYTVAPIPPEHIEWIREKKIKPENPMDKMASKKKPAAKKKPKKK